MARGEQRKTRRSGTFGSVDKLPSGRYRAQYYGPDGLRHKAPTTFLTIDDARGWLSLRQAEIISKAWKPPAAQPPKKLTFGEYANNWLRNRELEDRTREDYRAWLDAHVLPTLGDLPMARFEDREVIDEWYRTLNPDTPTLRARVYGLTSTIFNSAVDDSKKTGLSTNPCRIRGASTVKPAHKVRPATLAELEVLTLAMPSRFQAMVLLAAWCALRFGELTELRRKSIDLVQRKVWIDHGVVRLKSTTKGVARRKVKKPKTEAGRRPVTVPPHLVPALEDHLRDHVGSGADALLFPAANGGHLAPSTFYRHWYRACKAAGRWQYENEDDKVGRTDLTLHDCRHTGATLAAATGATLAGLMERLGHSTHQAAMRYQHAAAGSDEAIAQGLSAFVTPPTPSSRTSVRLSSRRSGRVTQPPSRRKGQPVNRLSRRTPRGGGTT
ncbi:site-specific integrase [Nocardia vulneris]|uniref:site-specific integrase n=1 Tax=Nocardia vulneris TaxID=1141657 RepID=UPI0009E5E90B|nr:site-specific integrase [Nocardia vulneris]